METLEKKLWNVAESGLKDDSFFLVDVKLSMGKQVKVAVLLDGDKGVTIDDCSRLSRHMGHIIEEENIIDSAYTLDVGSPGLEVPLQMERQYEKNIGRKLKIKSSSGEMIKGILESTLDSGIRLKIKDQVTDLDYKEIEWAKVQVSFNKN